MDKPPPTIKGRKIAILGGDGVDDKEVQTALLLYAKEGLVAELIGPHAGTVEGASGKQIKVNRAAPNAPSVVYDAVLVPHGVGPALAGCRLRSASSMKRIATGSLFLWLPMRAAFSRLQACRRATAWLLPRDRSF